MEIKIHSEFFIEGIINRRRREGGKKIWWEVTSFLFKQKENISIL